MTFSRYFVAALFVLGLTVTGRARAGEEDRGGALGSPDVTLRVGAVFPMFLIYEIPGPLVGVNLGWRMNANLQLIAKAELGAVFFDGAQRYMGEIGGGIRGSLWQGSLASPWLELGLGTSGYIERVGVVLPERLASATDVGALLTIDLALGVRIAERWELGVGWDHIVWPLPYYEVYTGSESQPHRGTATAWIGFEL